MKKRKNPTPPKPIIQPGPVAIATDEEMAALRSERQRLWQEVHVLEADLDAQIAALFKGTPAAEVAA